MELERVTRSRSLKVNLGNYESWDLMASVTATIAQGEEVNEVKLSAVLDKLLSADLHEAASLTPVDESFVFPLLGIDPKAPS